MFCYKILSKKEVYLLCLANLFFSLFFLFLNVSWVGILLLWIIGYVALIDFKTHDIPHDVNVVFIWLGLLYWGFLGDYRRLLVAIIIVFLLGVVSSLTNEGIGGGDLKFFFPLILFLDYWLFFLVYFFASLLGFIFSVGSGFKHGWSFRRRLPLMPFFYFGYIVTLAYLLFWI